MKVRALFVALCLAVLTACAAPAPAESPTTDAPDPVGAYEAMVSWLYHFDPGLNGHIFAIDASGTGLTDPQRLVAALEADPRYVQHEFVSATRAELQDRGLIHQDELWFEGGFLIEFSDPSIEAEKVTVKADKWASGTGAVYVTLTAHWDGAYWVVDPPTSIGMA